MPITCRPCVYFVSMLMYAYEYSDLCPVSTSESRLARQQQWQQTQECPPGGPGGGGGSSDLLSSRQQARSNPNLLQDAAPNPLLPSRSHGDLGPNPLMPSRSHGDLQAPGAGPLQQSRSHGRLYDAEPGRQGGHTGVQPAHPAHPSHQTSAQSAPNPTPATAPAPAKPQRTADQEPRAARPPSSRSQRPQQTPSPTEGGPGQMTRHTLHALSAAPRSNLRQEWVPRKRADAPRNAGQHWLIQVRQLGSFWGSLELIFFFCHRYHVFD